MSVVPELVVDVQRAVVGYRARFLPPKGLEVSRDDFDAIVLWSYGEPSEPVPLDGNRLFGLPLYVNSSLRSGEFALRFRR